MRATRFDNKIFLAVTFCLLFISGHGLAQTSVTYQVDAAHDGRVKTLSPFEPPLKQLWAVDLGGPVSYPIVAQNMVFVTVSNISTYGSQIFALNAATGKTIWRKSITGTYFSSYNAYENGVVFNLNFDGVLQAFDASTGTVVWVIQIPSQYEFSSLPVATGGYIYLVGAGFGATFYKLDEVKGSVIWSRNGNEGYEFPAVTATQVFVDAGCDVYALDISSGAILWDANAGCIGGLSGKPSVYNERVYAPYFNLSSEAAFRAKTGALKAILSNGSSAFREKLVFQNLQKTVAATDINSNNISWQFPTESYFCSAPIVINNSVYSLSCDGQLYALSAATGALKQQLTPGVGQNNSQGASVLSGLGFGQGTLFVPSVSRLTAYVPK